MAKRVYELPLRVNGEERAARAAEAAQRSATSDLRPERGRNVEPGAGEAGPMGGIPTYVGTVCAAVPGPGEARLRKAQPWHAATGEAGVGRKPSAGRSAADGRGRLS